MSKMLTDLNNENKRLKDEINNLKLSNLKSSRYKN